MKLTSNMSNDTLGFAVYYLRCLHVAFCLYTSSFTKVTMDCNSCVGTILSSFSIPTRWTYLQDSIFFQIILLKRIKIRRKLYWKYSDFADKISKWLAPRACMFLWAWFPVRSRKISCGKQFNICHWFYLEMASRHFPAGLKPISIGKSITISAISSQRQIGSHLHKNFSSWRRNKSHSRSLCIG